MKGISLDLMEEIISEINGKKTYVKFIPIFPPSVCEEIKRRGISIECEPTYKEEL